MKEGDKIYLAINNRVSFCEIVGLYSHCTELKNGDWHIIVPKCHKGLFYNFGYDSEKRYLFLKKLWHYYFAVIIEKIRLIIPTKMTKLIKLEK